MQVGTSEFECNARLRDYYGFSGITFGHAVNARDGVDSTLYEYALMSERESIGRKLNAKGTRAHREIQRREGKEVPQIKDGALRGELLVLPGAALSAIDVVNALRRLIEEIEKDGMCIGKYKGERLIEKVDGTLISEAA